MEIKDKLFEKIFSSPIPKTRFWGKGFFYAFRHYPYLGLRRIDDNFFCTALTINLLSRLSDGLSEPILSQLQAKKKYFEQETSAYCVKRGNTKVYQFWPDRRKAHFPNGNLLKHFKKFKSPPDADDTALAYQVFDFDPLEVKNWQHYLRTFANGARKWNLKVRSEWQQPKVYGTWMGTGKMPIEFDTVVMTNILSAIFKYQIPLDEYGAQTLNFIQLMIYSGDYLRYPFEAAPWYPNSILIHYHLVEFVTRHSIENKLDLLKKLSVQNHVLAQSSKLKFMEEVLVKNAALKLGLSPIKLILSNNWEKEADSFPFYIGGMLTAATSKISWKLAKYSIFHWQFICPALNCALIVEYFLLESR